MDMTAAVRGSGKSFGDVIALDRIDLNVARGQIHGLVGPNGARKTTLLGLLPGLVHARLYRSQEQELRRPPVTEAQLQATAACPKGDRLCARDDSGNDWRCTVSWHIPDVAVTGQTIHQPDVNANGRYIADGDVPKEVNGYFLVRTPDGDEPNPLWQFDGDVGLLPSR